MPGNAPLRRPLRVVAEASLVLAALGGSPGAAPESGIWPGLTFSSCLGGSGADTAGSAALAPDGTLWIVGHTTSADFPGAEGGPPGPGTKDALVVRFDPVARRVLSATLLGGSADDRAYDLAIDSAGNAFVVGSTDSPDFPAAGGPRTWYAGGRDGFLAKIAPDGRTVLWSTFLGGSGFDEAYDVAATAAGDSVVCGMTESSDFPTAAAFEPARRGAADAFLAVLRGDGSGFAFSSFLGGNGYDGAWALGLAPSGRIVVGGMTRSSDLRAAGSFGELPEGDSDGFLALVEPDGSAVVREAYLGGGGSDYVGEIAIEASGSLLVAGKTESPDFPATAAPHGPPSEYDEDGFLLRVDADLGTVREALLFGGSGDDSVGNVVPATDGKAWILGRTRSADLPALGATLPLPASDDDLCVASFDLGGAGLTSSTYLGGHRNDFQADILIATDGAPWVVGTTLSPDFPAVSPLQEGLAGGLDFFVARIPPLPRKPPRPPDDLEVAGVAGYSVDLRWEDLSSDETGFAVFRREPEFPWRSYSRIATLPASTTRFVDRAVLPDREYRYAVQSFHDSAGSAASPPVDARTPATLELAVEGGTYSGFNEYSPGGWLVIRGTALPGEGLDGGIPDPRNSGVSWSAPNDYGGRDGFGIPPDDPGWAVTRRGLLRWRDPQGHRDELLWDPSSGRFVLRVLWPGDGIRPRDEYRGGEPWRLRVEFGTEAGSTTVLWRWRNRRGRGATTP